MQDHSAAIQQAQTALNKAQAALTAAQQELQKQQDTLSRLQRTLGDNQANVANAQAALQKAQTKAVAATTALASAKENLANAQPDAVKYGKQIKIKQVVITVGDAIPSPTIDSNDIIVENAPAAQSLVLMTLAAVPEQAGHLPAGTVAKWADFVKVKHDAAKDGTYAEDVLVTFPDESTYTVHGASLVVKPKAASTTKPSKGTETGHNQGSATKPTTKPSQGTNTGHNQSSTTPTTKPSQGTDTSHNQSSSTEPSAKPSHSFEPSTTPAQSTHSNANVPAASEGETTAQNAVTSSKNEQQTGIIVNNSPVVPAQSAATPQQLAATMETHQQDQVIAAMIPSNASTEVREQGTTSEQTTGQLPQTGNDANSVLSLIGFAFTAVLAMLGIEKRHN